MYSGNDGLFHVVEGAQAVIRKGAVFKQKRIYRRGRDLYIPEAGGYIGLRKDGGTGKPDMSWDYIEGVNYRVKTGVVACLELTGQ